MTDDKREAFLSEHLRNGQQCDEEGIMCIVSRQACHEAADTIDALIAERDALREALREIARLGGHVSHDLVGRVEAGKIAAVARLPEIARAALKGGGE